MSHVLLIAAIFVPYMALMVGLGVYIARTGRHEDRHDGDEDRDPDGLLAAA